MSSALGAPLRDGKPIVTITLIGLCAVAYLLQMVLPNDDVQRVAALIPAALSSSPWRLVTSAFLHVGIVHLLMNMYALWAVGSFLEIMLGRWRFLVVYLASALGGSLAVLAWAEYRGGSQEWLGSTMGASGAIFGLFGAMLLVVRRVGANAGGILAVIAINVVFSFTVGSISWQGHMGGLATGLAMGAVFAFAGREHRTRVGVIGTVGAAIVLGGLAVWLIGAIPPEVAAVGDAVVSQPWG
jgi:membrane associated rhomboid family serine protease